MEADTKSPYALPPARRTGDGAPRRVGVELEFSGLDLDAAAAAVADALGGRVDVATRYEQTVDVEGLGRFGVELDFEYLKTRAREEEESGKENVVGIGAAVAQASDEAVAAVARRVVPVEVVTPPIPIDALSVLDDLVAALRSAGALGTASSPVYAFGLHLNPEMPALDAGTVLAYTQAFLCLHDWLSAQEGVDLSRRMTPYVNAFPRRYVAQALDPTYAPGIDRFIDDYLVSNADRNRALDLLPLLAHIDEARVRAVIDDPRIKARPALHYRLPDCEVDREDWGVHVAWNDWVLVERLAADDDARAALCAHYLAHLERGVGALLDPWSKRCGTLLEDTLR